MESPGRRIRGSVGRTAEIVAMTPSPHPRSAGQSRCEVQGREARPWTPGDDGILVGLRKSGGSYEEIAEALARTRAACQQRAVIIGATRPQSRGSTDDDCPQGKQTRKRRACLRCAEVFMSDGAHNRLCDDCREFARENSADAVLAFEG